MDLRLVYAVLLTFLPGTELRIGLPLAILYGKDFGIPLILIFILILLVNLLLIFFVFYFLDRIHHRLMNLRVYKRFSSAYLKKFQKKVDKFEKKHASLGFFALFLFVAVPLPGTGAWSGSLISWLLNLDRKKSILAISLGVVAAGLLVFMGVLGFMSLFL